MSQFDPSKINRSRLGGVVDRLVPAREVTIRSGATVQFYKISSAQQMATFGVVAALLVWSLYVSTAYFGHNTLSRHKDHQVSATNHQVLAERVAESKNDVEAIASDLVKSREFVVTLRTRAASIEDLVHRIESEVDNGTVIIRGGAGVRDQIVSRLRLLAERVKTVTVAERSGVFLDSSQQRVAALDGDPSMSLVEGLLVAGHNQKINDNWVRLQRDLAAQERDRLAMEIAALKGRAEEMRNNAQRVAVLKPSEPAHASEPVQDSKATVEKTAVVEKIAVAPDVEVKKLARIQAPSDGRGGPFIPVDAVALSSRKVKAAFASLHVIVGTDNLQDMARRVPLGPPLLHFQLTSTFGTREDPINGNLARHDGLDLAAPSGTPVYSPASGVVVFVGRKDRYGRSIIINHGHGFGTLYGHLNKTLVIVGQKVETGARIGLVGSTGRSTGPHLHYEVRFNGKPRDPYPFIKVSRDVLKG
ncbi:MAG: M23 family metallopeptidase [Alphaproteobacteria bacterium]|nr:M23 family metallopeptidase [Alphaproteobacteria bacterium]